MSGAGKSTALKSLEDKGYFCVDNLPVMLIPKFAEIASDDKLPVESVAIGIDIRNGEALDELSNVLDELRLKGLKYEILFLDAHDVTLVKRYKETRRSHPLSGEGRIEDGITAEREKIAFLREKADFIIDTSSLLTRELNEEIDHIVSGDDGYENLIVTVMSFGFKYGIPADSDLVFDVRFLPNPYYVAELKPLTGNEKPVADMVKDCEEYEAFMSRLYDMVSFLLPNYKKEGKNALVISIGCTGGRHRSVTCANDLYSRLSTLPYTVRLVHKDIDRKVK